MNERVYAIKEELREIENRLWQIEKKEEQADMLAAEHKTEIELGIYDPPLSEEEVEALREEIEELETRMEELGKELEKLGRL